MEMRQRVLRRGILGECRCHPAAPALLDVATSIKSLDTATVWQAVSALSKGRMVGLDGKDG